MTTKVKVLLIEDDRSISNFITTALDSNGYKVIAATGGKEGISLAASVCPDIVLLDLGLPDIDGIEVLKQTAKKNNRRKQLLAA